MKFLSTNHERRTTNDENGAVLILSFIVMITLISVVGAYLGFVHTSTRSTGAQIVDSQIFYLADAGIGYGIYSLKQDSSWTGTASPVSLGEGTFSITAASLGGDDYRITSTGTVFGRSRTVQQDVTLATTAASWAAAFSYAIYGNEISGTLELKDNVTINGHVYYDYSNGSVDIQDSASVNGDYFVYANSVSGNGTKASEAPDPVPGFPTFDTTTYDDAIDDAGSVSNLTLDGSDNLDLSGTVYYQNVTIKDSATVTGSGTIVATNNLTIRNDANIGEDITFIADNSIDVREDAIIQQGGILYGNSNITIRGNANVSASVIGPVSGKNVKIEDDVTLTGIIYADQVELKEQVIINGVVVADTYKTDRIIGDVTVNYDSSYLPSSIPAGLESVAGETTATLKTDTWQEQ